MFVQITTTFVMQGDVGHIGLQQLAAFVDDELQDIIHALVAGHGDGQVVEPPKLLQFPFQVSLHLSLCQNLRFEVLYASFHVLSSHPPGVWGQVLH